MLRSDKGMYSTMRVGSDNGDVFQKQLTLAACFDSRLLGSPSFLLVSRDISGKRADGRTCRQDVVLKLAILGVMLRKATLEAHGSSDWL